MKEPTPARHPRQSANAYADPSLGVSHNYPSSFRAIKKARHSITRIADKDYDRLAWVLVYIVMAFAAGWLSHWGGG